MTHKRALAGPMMGYSPDLERLIPRIERKLRAHRLEYGCGVPAAGGAPCAFTRKLVAMKQAARVLVANREFTNFELCEPVRKEKTA